MKAIDKVYQLVNAASQRFEDMQLNEARAILWRCKYKAERWAAKACADTAQTRPGFNYLCVKDGMAVGTDGWRCHAAETDLADGFYVPETLEEAPSMGLVFPAIAQLVGRKMQDIRSKNSISAASINVFDGDGISHIWDRGMEYNIRRDWLDDACAGEDVLLDLWNDGTVTGACSRGFFLICANKALICKKVAV